MNRRLLALAFLPLLAGLSMRADAPQRAGLVTALRGNVELLRPGQDARKPAVKDPIFEGDTVRTGNRGRVQICFEDDSIVSIGNNATLVVTKYLFDPSAKQGAMEIEVKEGFFRVLGGAVTRIAPENFETVAGTASIGIRGCSFGGQVAGGAATIVFFGSNIGGEIGITGASVYRALATPADGVTVPRNGPPSMPSPMERFGVRILGETSLVPGATGTDGDGTPGVPGDPTNPTRNTDRDLPGLLPNAEGSAVLNGFAIGQELETGWIYRNGSADLLRLEVTVDDGLLGTVASGGMLVSVHTDADFGFDRDDNFLLPLLSFSFANGTISDGVDPDGNTIVAVTESAILPAPEPKAAMNWGEWEMTIVDPNSVVREARTLRGLWIGSDLPQTDLESLRDQAGALVLGGDFQGTYDGFAHCIRNGTTPSDATAASFAGTSHYEVSFRSRSFTGDFDFTSADGPTLRFAGAVNADGSVQGTCQTVSGEDVISSKSKIEGALFDNAKAIGTSWNAKTTSNSYIGVAGAVGTVTPAGVGQ